jgi:hypothetical protein
MKNSWIQDTPYHRNIEQKYYDEVAYLNNRLRVFYWSHILNIAFQN